MALIKIRGSLNETQRHKCMKGALKEVQMAGGGAKKGEWKGGYKEGWGRVIRTHHTRIK